MNDEINIANNPQITVANDDDDDDSQHIPNEDEPSVSGYFMRQRSINSYWETDDDDPTNNGNESIDEPAAQSTSTNSDIQLREFSIVAPTIEEGMRILQEEKEERKKANEKKLLDRLATLDDKSDIKRGDCEICCLGIKSDTVLLPCGHICCNKCWKKNIEMHKKKYSRFDLEICEPRCWYCRGNVKKTHTIFF